MKNEVSTYVMSSSHRKLSQAGLIVGLLAILKAQRADMVAIKTECLDPQNELRYRYGMNKSIYKLLAGFRRFKEKYFLSEGSIFSKLAESGQTPKTLLIGCSDSRVDPAILTDAAPGEIFVVRNVGNLVPPCAPSAEGGFHGTSSAIEFAVVNLKVENIIILGHSQCGGINALLSGATENSKSFIGKWMTIAEEVRPRVQALNAPANSETKWRLAEMESLKVSLKNLQTFPFVKSAVNEGKLTVLAVYFDLEQGELLEYDIADDQFHSLQI